MSKLGDDEVHEMVKARQPTAILSACLKGAEVSISTRQPAEFSRYGCMYTVVESKAVTLNATTSCFSGTTIPQALTKLR